MSPHVSVEQLSSYLDAELARRERDDLERHLDDCSSCRHRLEGLRRVVARLHRLEQQAPPADLASLVERRVAAEADRAGLRAQLERTVRTVFVQPSLTPVFGLVVALALILYLFSFAVARDRATGTRLVVPSAESSPSRQTVRMIEGRDFLRVDAVWVERGLGAAAPEAVLEFTADSPAPPALAPFARLGGRVRLAHEGHVVELVFSGSP